MPFTKLSELLKLLKLQGMLVGIPANVITDYRLA